MPIMIRPAAQWNLQLRPFQLEALDLERIKEAVTI